MFQVNNKYTKMIPMAFKPSGKYSAPEREAGRNRI